MAEAVVTVALAYLLGSFPTAYLLGKRLRNIDIRREGSQNPGALNAYRRLGKLAGVVVLAVDAGKGALALYIGSLLGAPDTALYFAAGAATLGHNFTPFTGFRGGKGGSIVLGLSAAMVWEITAISIGAGAVLFAVTRHPVRSVAGIFVVLNILTITTGQPAGLIALCLALSFVVAGTHVFRQYPQLVSGLKSREWRRITDVD